MIIVTGDIDTLQLVNPHVRVLHQPPRDQRHRGLRRRRGARALRLRPAARRRLQGPAGRRQRQHPRRPRSRREDRHDAHPRARPAGGDPRGGSADEARPAPGQPRRARGPGAPQQADGHHPVPTSTCPSTWPAPGSAATTSPRCTRSSTAWSSAPCCPGWARRSATAPPRSRARPARASSASMRRRSPPADVVVVESDGPVRRRWLNRCGSAGRVALRTVTAGPARTGAPLGVAVAPVGEPRTWWVPLPEHRDGDRRPARRSRPSSSTATTSSASASPGGRSCGRPRLRRHARRLRRQPAGPGALADRARRRPLRRAAGDRGGAARERPRAPPASRS